MVDRIVSLHGNIIGLSDQGFAIKLLSDPGTRQAYSLLTFAASLKDGGANGGDGVTLALHDGEIEEALLDRGAALGDATGLVTSVIAGKEGLHIYHSVALNAFGTGNSGFITAPPMHWPGGFLTPNEQWLLGSIPSGSSSTKNLLVHIGFDNVRVTDKTWTTLKHRGPVIDRAIANIA